MNPHSIGRFRVPSDSLSALSLRRTNGARRNEANTNVLNTPKHVALLARLIAVLTFVVASGSYVEARDHFECTMNSRLQQGDASWSSATVGSGGNLNNQWQVTYDPEYSVTPERGTYYFGMEFEFFLIGP